MDLFETKVNKDEVFDNPSLKPILDSLPPEQVRQIARNFASVGYPYATPGLRPVPDRFSVQSDFVKPEATGFESALASSAKLHNLGGRLIYGAMSMFSNPVDDKGKLDVDAWFSDEKNRQYLNGLKGGVGDRILSSYVNGDYDHIRTADAFFATIGEDVADGQLREEASRGEGFGAFAGGMLGGVVDPTAVVGGSLLASAGKAVSVGKVAANVKRAEGLAAIAVKSPGLAGVVARNIVEGTIITAAQEAGLHALDSRRTAEDTATNLASNIVFNSAIAGGIHALRGGGFKGNIRVSIVPEEVASRFEAFVKGVRQDAEVKGYVGKVEQEPIQSLDDLIHNDALEMERVQRRAERVAEAQALKNSPEFKAEEQALIDAINKDIEASTPKDINQIMQEISDEIEVNSARKNTLLSDFADPKKDPELADLLRRPVTEAEKVAEIDMAIELGELRLGDGVKPKDYDKLITKLIRKRVKDHLEMKAAIDDLATQLNDPNIDIDVVIKDAAKKLSKLNMDVEDLIDSVPQRIEDLNAPKDVDLEATARKSVEAEQAPDDIAEAMRLINEDLELAEYNRKLAEAQAREQESWDAAMAEVEANRAKAQAAPEAETVKPASDGSPPPPSGTEPTTFSSSGDGAGTTSYADYYPVLGKDKLDKLLKVVDESMNNRLVKRPITVHGVLTVSHPELHMFYQKFFRPLFAGKAYLEGKTKGEMPFEAVVSMMRAKTKGVMYDFDQDFRKWARQSGKAGWFQTTKNAPKELWSPELHAMEARWYEAMDLLRAARESYIVSNVDAAATGNLDWTEKAVAAMQAQHPQAFNRLKALLISLGSKEPEVFKETIKALHTSLVKNYPRIERIRGGVSTFASNRGNYWMRPGMEDIARGQTSAMRTSVRLDPEITVNDFLKLWQVLKTTTDADGAIKFDGRQITAEDMLKEFHEMKAGIGFEEIANPTPSTAMQLRNIFYKRFGGYVPSNKLMDVVALQMDAHQAPLATVDLRSSISKSYEAFEQIELAHTLKNYLAEATKETGINDQGLRNRITIGSTSPEAEIDGLVLTKQRTLIDSFHQLEAIRASRSGSEVFVPDWGYMVELRNWNEKALNAIEANMTDKVMGYDVQWDKPDVKLSQKVREQNKEVIGSFFDYVRSRTGFEGERGNKFASDTFGVVAAGTRTLFLTAQIFNQLQDFGQSVATLWSYPLKKDLSELAKQSVTNLRTFRENGGDLGALAESIEFVHDNLRNLIINQTSRSLGDDASNLFSGGDPAFATKVVNGQELRTSVPEYGLLQKTSGWLRNRSGRAMEVLGGGQGMLDINRNLSLFSTYANVMHSEQGLLSKLDRAYKLTDSGVSLADAMAREGIPPHWANWSMRYLSRQDVATVLTKSSAKSMDVKIGTDFFGIKLDKLTGDTTWKVVDYDKKISAPEMKSFENVAMFINEMASRERQSLPNWGDDLLGANGFWSSVMTFWLKPSMAVFNHAFRGQAYKGMGAKIGIITSMSAIAMATDIAKAELNYDMNAQEYRGNKKLEEISTRFPYWFADRLGWVGIFGGPGERVVRALAMTTEEPTVQSNRSFDSFFVPAPASAVTTGFKAVRGGLSVGGTSKQDADAIWRMASAVGFANDAAAFKLLGKGLRATGLYGEENNAPDFKRFIYDRLGVPVEKK